MMILHGRQTIEEDGQRISKKQTFATFFFARSGRRIPDFCKFCNEALLSYEWTAAEVRARLRTRSRVRALADPDLDATAAKPLHR